MIECAIFDCDGVLLDSNGIKSDAFVRCLDGYPPGDVDQLLVYHKANGGITRQQKLRFFLEQITAFRGDIDAELARLVERFSDVCSKELERAPIVPGVPSFLEVLASAEIPCYVVSGGAEAEVKQQLSMRNLDVYFAGIFGNPISKRDHVEKLLATNLAKKRMVYFGDAKLDLELADLMGAQFVFVSGYSEWQEGRAICTKREKVTVIENFSNFRLDLGA